MAVVRSQRRRRRLTAFIGDTIMVDGPSSIEVNGRTIRVHYHHPDHCADCKAQGVRRWTDAVTAPEAGDGLGPCTDPHTYGIPCPFCEANPHPDKDSDARADNVRR